MNHWTTSDIATTASYELHRLTSVYTTHTYPLVADALSGVEIYIPALPGNPTATELATAARVLASVARDVRASFPAEEADVADVAHWAVTKAAGAAQLLAFYGGRPRAYHRQATVEATINAAGARAKAVVAFLGIEPEEAGLMGDTLAEREATV